MKTLVVSAVSILLVSIFYCPMAMAAPSMPSDLQMVQPDPSLPKELAAFWGKWEGADSYMEYMYIVEKIDNEKANIYLYRSRPLESAGAGWFRYEGIVTKEGKKYKVSFRGAIGPIDLTLKGEDLLNVSGTFGSLRFKRVQ